eukprot:sb/3465713/
MACGKEEKWCLYSIFFLLLCLQLILLGSLYAPNHLYGSQYKEGSCVLISEGVDVGSELCYHDDHWYSFPCIVVNARWFSDNHNGDDDDDDKESDDGKKGQLSDDISSAKKGCFVEPKECKDNYDAMMDDIVTYWKDFIQERRENPIFSCGFYENKIILNTTWSYSKAVASLVIPSIIIICFLPFFCRKTYLCWGDDYVISSSAIDTGHRSAVNRPGGYNDDRRNHRNRLSRELSEATQPEEQDVYRYEDRRNRADRIARDLARTEETQPEEWEIYSSGGRTAGIAFSTVDTVELPSNMTTNFTPTAPTYHTRPPPPTYHAQHPTPSDPSAPPSAPSDSTTPAASTSSAQLPGLSDPSAPPSYFEVMANSAPSYDSVC